jgi:hypothetical protein
MQDDEILKLAHRTAWKYKLSSDPSHSDTYKFNNSCMIDFEMPHPLPFHFTTLAEIELKEKHQNDSFKKWMSSGEFRFLHDRNRVELEDCLRGCFSVMADLQAEILRLKQI